MQVFIEQSGEKNKKNIFDKETGQFVKAINFHITYPYPYGYILNTHASDGDELDCYVITDQKLEVSSEIDCEAIGMVEYVENGQPDHKIFVRLKGEDRIIDDEVKNKLLHFNIHYFKGKTNVSTQIGKFLGKEDALKEINKAILK